MSTLGTPASGGPGEQIEFHKASLARAVADEVAQGGQIEAQSDYQAVVKQLAPRPVNHIAHGIGTLLTAGLWAFGWWAAVSKAKKHPLIVQVQLRIDHGGHVVRTTHIVGSY